MAGSETPNPEPAPEILAPVMAGSETPNPEPARGIAKPARRIAAPAAVVLLVLATVAAVVLPQLPAVTPGGSTPGSTPGGSAASAGNSPRAASASTAPAAAPSATSAAAPVPPDAWQQLPLPAYTPVADLEATQVDSSGVAPDTDFVLTARNGEPPGALAARLEVAPVVKLQVSESSGKTLVRPASALNVGALYRFAIRGPDGSLQGSWVFQVRQPLHVVGTLPHDEATDVPPDTGIEVTFDQDGFSRAPSFFEIRPAVTGTFRAVGRVLAFVPSALQPRTVYRVTIRHGLPLDGSDQVLEKDVSFAFETGAPGVEHQPPSLSFPQRVYESPTAEAPTLIVDTRDWREGGPQPRNLSGSVYRFADLTRALAALDTVENAPAWMVWNDAALVPTTRLQRVSTFTVRAGPVSTGWGNGLWFRLPTALRAGWYLVSLPVDGVEIQAFLQVTDVATYVSVFSDSTVVWVHDLATGGPLAGATVQFAAGAGQAAASGPGTGTTTLGRTDARGLLTVATPAALAASSSSAAPSALPTLTARAGDGRTGAIAGSMWPGNGYSGWGYSYDGSTTDDYWQLFHTDRSLYRQTDTINVFGVIRDRDAGTVPSGLVVRLVSGDGWDPTVSLPAIVERKLAPNQAGAFTASLPIRDVPIGWYLVEVRAGTRRLAVESVSVDVISKPAYRVSVKTDRDVYFAGDPIRVSVSATFYDGTPVRGLALYVGEDTTRDGRRTRLTTDATGTASASMTARMDSTGQSTWQGFEVRPISPEEGDISTYSGVLVYASRTYLEAATRFVGSQISVAGTTYQRELPGAGAADDSSELWDAHGRPAPGVTVTATIVGHIPVAKRTGERYDFIAKKVIPVYDYDIEDVPLGTRRVTADADGAFAFTLDVADSRIKACTVTLTAPDAAGRTTTLGMYEEWTEPPSPETPGETPSPSSPVDTWGTSDEPTRPYLAVDDPQKSSSGCSSWSCASGATYAVGETVRAVLRDELGTYPSAPDAYLFLVEQRGLRQVILQDSAHLAVTFDESAIPNLWLSGVRFTGSGYLSVSDGFMASFDEQLRALDVTVTPGASAYRPGDTVTLHVLTASAADGNPVPATVVLAAIDQKLYDMGAAYDSEPLGELYSRVSSGLKLHYASHQAPVPMTGGGSTGGGGGGASLRDDFRDTALFRQLGTDARGRATVTFTAPDDITSWHLSAYALTDGLQAGVTHLAIPVSLPFFADATLAPEYLVSDRPTISLRAQGDALRAGDRVTFTVSSDTLSMAPRTVTAPAFGVAELALPPLREGTQKLVIRATAGSGSRAVSDALVRTFQVVTSRVTREQVATAQLGPGFPPTGGSGMTTYTFSDAGRGRFLWLLRSLAWDDGPRVDQALAAREARSLLATYFPGMAVDAPPASFQADQYEKYGSGTSDITLVALLPYASGDLELTVRTLLAAPEAFDADRFRLQLPHLLSDPAMTSEEKLLALVGLAALGEPVLGDLREAAAASDATPTMHLYAALGLAALGDEAGARAIERALIAGYGQRYGSLVRLHVSEDPSEISEATALLAVLAAGLGDPAGDQAEAYVEGNPSATALLNLQQLAYVERAIERATGTGARFAYTVSGTRTERALAAGESWSLTLTPAQRASFGAEVVRGSVVVTTSWSAPLDASTNPLDPDLTVTRAVAPAGVLSAGSLVDARFTVSVTGVPATGCYLLTEAVPSGLVALTWERYYEAPDADKFTWPWLVEGQRVQWYVCDLTRPPRYLARVLTTGTYTWEPAVLQSSVAAERLALTAPTTVTIR